MSRSKSPESTRKRYAELCMALAALGPILQGSILPRRFKRPHPSRKGKSRIYGPYYQWTRKQAGKTINLNLGPLRAAAFTKAIREHRKLDRILAQMHILSQQILESSTPDIPRRSPRKLKK
jgi:hypothetical protein